MGLGRECRTSGAHRKNLTDTQRLVDTHTHTHIDREMGSGSPSEDADKSGRGQ